jgi:hypothetical protein
VGSHPGATDRARPSSLRMALRDGLRRAGERPHGVARVERAGCAARDYGHRRARLKNVPSRRSDRPCEVGCSRMDAGSPGNGLQKPTCSSPGMRLP